MSNIESPYQWAKRMMDEAKDVEVAMMYFELMNLWKEREEKWDIREHE